MNEPKIKGIHSFVRRCGHMSEGQKALLTQNQGGYLVPLPKDGEQLQWSQLFARPNPVTVEIGFGMGDSLLYFIDRFPNRNLLGIEVHEPGIARVLSLLRRAGVPRDNLKLMMGDAVTLMERFFPDDSVDAFHLFFPDPWPKKRHHKRRLLQRPFVELLLTKLKTGGTLATATDWEPYGLEMHALFESIPLLQSEGEGGFCDRLPCRPVTKFEQKGLEAHRRIINLLYRKGDGPTSHQGVSASPSIE